jgi:hypothetical protein
MSSGWSVVYSEPRGRSSVRHVRKFRTRGEAIAFSRKIRLRAKISEPVQNPLLGIPVLAWWLLGGAAVAGVGYYAYKAASTPAKPAPLTPQQQAALAAGSAAAAQQQAANASASAGTPNNGSTGAWAQWRGQPSSPSTSGGSTPGNDVTNAVNQGQNVVNQGQNVVNQGQNIVNQGQQTYSNLTGGNTGNTGDTSGDTSGDTTGDTSGDTSGDTGS